MQHALLQLGRPFAPRYRPAPPDSEREREIRRRAARDRDAGIMPRDWPPEELEGLMKDPKAYRELLRTYDPARHPERLEAPPRWPEQIALIAAAMPMWVLSEPGFSWRAWWTTLLLTPASSAHDRARTAARRRSARRLGLTPRTAPRPAAALDPWILMAAATVLALRRWRREGRAPRRRSPWDLYLAAEIVRAIEERRSYNAALRRTSTGAPDSKDSTAASQTAAAA